MIPKTEIVTGFAKEGTRVKVITAAGIFTGTVDYYDGLSFDTAILNEIKLNTPDAPSGFNDASIFGNVLLLKDATFSAHGVDAKSCGAESFALFTDQIIAIKNESI